MTTIEQVSSFLSSLPVLEPLCKATMSQLQPSRLFINDYIEIGLNDDMRRFILNPITCHGGVNSGHPASEGARRTWFKRIPEHKQDKHSGIHSCAASDFSALIIAHQWPEDRIIWKSKEAETMYKFLLARFLVQTKNAVAVAQFKVNSVLPKLSDHYKKHPELPLAPYQEAALGVSVLQEAFSLFMQQGTGKTAIIIARICMEARLTRLGLLGGVGEKGRMMRVLIVCPRQARMNWQNEIERFTTSLGKAVVLRGGLHRRIRGVTDAIRQEDDCEFGAAICSYQTIDNTWDAIGNIPWDLVILDESHYIKNPQSLRSKRTRQLRDNSARRCILTGTPIVNSVMDLWAQWEFLGDGLSGFMSFKEFKSFYGKWERAGGPVSGSGIEKLVGVKNLPLIQERLTRLAFTITKKEAGLQLPEKVYDIYEVKMGTKQVDYYNKLTQELALEIEADKKNPQKTLTANHILTRLLRLAQITSGHVKWDPIYAADGTVKDYAHVEQIEVLNAKVDGCIEMIQEDAENDPDSKTIIWAIFREDIRILEEKFTEAGIRYVSFFGDTKDADREENVRLFNEDPKVKVFIGNPSSAAEALNLLGYDWWNAIPSQTTYTGHEIFFSQDWSPVKRSQSEDRAHRKGTKGTVRITDLVVPGTIDQEIRERVYAKRKDAMEIQDVTELLSRVLNAKLTVED